VRRDRLSRSRHRENESERDGKPTQGKLRLKQLPMYRDASSLHVQVVSYLTVSDRIAHGGQKNVWDKVSCGPSSLDAPQFERFA
jgi:hypothetical protein